MLGIPSHKHSAGVAGRPLDGLAKMPSRTTTFKRKFGKERNNRVSMLTEGEKRFINLATEDTLLFRLAQSPPLLVEWKYKRPDFLVSIKGRNFFVEVKSGAPGEMSGEEYHRLLNTSIAFGIPVVVVWIDHLRWARVTTPIINNGTVTLETFPLTTITDIAS